MAVCFSCQAEIPEGANFCRNCGLPLGQIGRGQVGEAEGQAEKAYRYQTHPLACILSLLFAPVWLCMASFAYTYGIRGLADLVFYFIAVGPPILAVWSGLKELGLYPTSVREVAIAERRIIFRRRSGKEDPVIDKVVSVRERGRGAGRRLI